MVDFDLKSYTDLYLVNARQEIQTLKELLDSGQDIVELHRLSHALKGQSYFMKFNEIGDKAEELELFFRNLLDKNLTTDSGLDQQKKILSNIENLLISIKI